MKLAARIALAIALVGLLLSQIVAAQLPLVSTSFATPVLKDVAVEPLPLELYCPGLLLKSVVSLELS